MDGHCGADTDGTKSDAKPFQDADPRLRQVLDYWRQKRGERALPARRGIDPAELIAVLPHLMLVDVEEGPRFRYRLFGTAVAEAFGMDPTGKYIDVVMLGAYKEFLLGLYHDMLAMKKPIYSTSIYGTKRATTLWTQRLILPLSSDGEKVDMVLACQVFIHGSPLKTLTVRLARDKAEPIENIANPLGWKPVGNRRGGFQTRPTAVVAIDSCEWARGRRAGLKPAPTKVYRARSSTSSSSRTFFRRSAALPLLMAWSTQCATWSASTSSSTRFRAARMAWSCVSTSMQ